MSLAGVWRECFSNKGFRIRFFISSICLAILALLIPSFLNFLELRNGFVPYDALLASFEPKDVSTFTFVLTYSATIAGLFYFLHFPQMFLRTMMAYVFMMSMRILCLYFIPLDPPDTTIPLKDIFLSSFFYSGNVYVNDLFFSGHTATIILFAFCAEHKKWKYYFGLSSVLIAVCVLWQHVHYTVDVLAAPIASYLSWSLSSRAMKETTKTQSPPLR